MQYLAPPTRAAETTSETEAVISNLYPTLKDKLILERLFVLEDGHGSQNPRIQS